MSDDRLKQLVDKLKLWHQKIRDKLTSKPNLSQTDQNKKLSYNKILVGLSVGFILGALGSSVILYMRIAKIQKEYENAKLMFNSKLKSCQRLSKQYTQNTFVPPNVLSVINAIPSSDVFASFYAKLIKEKEQEHSQKPKPENTSKQNTLITTSSTQPVKLPPLKSLIVENSSTNNQFSSNLPLTMPPIPQISVIVCSNTNENCYAVSPNGTVYTNGYMEGNYKLVVTPSQVYWVKIHKNRSEN